MSRRTSFDPDEPDCWFSVHSDHDIHTTCNLIQDPGRVVLQLVCGDRSYFTKVVRGSDYGARRRDQATMLVSVRLATWSITTRKRSASVLAAS